MATVGSGSASGGFAAASSLPRDSRGPIVIGLAGLCMGLGVVAVGSRLYTRCFIVRRLGIDDAMAVLALAFLLALGIGQILTVPAGLGTHVYLLRAPNDFVAFFRGLWFDIVFYNIALLFIKMTFLFQYYQVVAQVRRLRIGYIVAMFLIGGWTVSQIFITIFTCVPVYKFWDQSVKGRCSNNAAELDLNAIGNIITDFIVLALPLPVLLRLRLERPQKLALIGIFCLGFLTCIISIIRRVFLKFTADITYSSVDVTSWSIAEVTSGIMCSALPTLRPLFGRFFPSLSGTFHKLSSGYRHAKSASGSSSSGGAAADRPWAFHSRGSSKADEAGYQHHHRRRDDEESFAGGRAAARVAAPRAARLRDQPGAAKLIGGKPTQISWPVEVHTSISGNNQEERPVPPPKDGLILVARELKIESYHQSPR